MWEGKSSFLFHLDLCTELATHSLTLAHYLHIWCIHGLNFHLVSTTKSCTGNSHLTGFAIPQRAPHSFLVELACPQHAAHERRNTPGSAVRAYV